MARIIDVRLRSITRQTRSNSLSTVKCRASHGSGLLPFRHDNGTIRLVMALSNKSRLDGPQRTLTAMLGAAIFATMPLLPATKAAETAQCRAPEKRPVISFR